MRLLTLLTTSIFLFDAFGLVPNFSRPSRQRGPSVNSSVITSDTPAISISSASSVQVESCTSRDNDISLAMFNSIVESRSGSEIGLKSFDPDSNRIQINIPSYVSSCVSLAPKISSIFNDGNKQFARLVLRNEKDMSAYDGYSMEEKIESCLKAEGLLVDDGNGVFSWSDNVFDNITEPKVLTTTLSGNEIDKSMQLGIVYGSPGISEYPKSVKLTDNSECYYDESMGEQLTFLRDEKTASDNRIVNLCESLNLDDIQQELESQAKLEPYQQSLLSNVLRQAQEKYVEEKLALLEDIGKEIIETDNYDVIKDLGIQYLSELESLENEIIIPAKDELIQLGENLSKAKSTDERRQINSDMNKLSELIGALSSTSSSRILPQVLDKLLEYGQADTANKAALISIKSNEYAKAKRYIDSSSRSRSRSITRIFRSVDGVIDAEYRKFKQRSAAANEIFEERTGLTKLSPQVKSELDRLVRIRDQKFDLAVRNIQRELAKCQKNFLGIMTSPISCKNATTNQAEWYREALSEKEKYNEQISKLAAKYSFYTNLEKEASSGLSDILGGQGEGYEHNSSNYLGSYGMYNDSSSSSSSNSADLHRIEQRDLTLGNFNVGANSSYQSYFSSPSRVSPYASMNQPSQVGYGFH